MFKLKDWIDQDKINWSHLSANPSARALTLLEKNQDKIDWWKLSENPSALTLLEKNQDKIDWDMLSSNIALSLLMFQSLFYLFFFCKFLLW
jgi:hypothetical protein